MIKKVKKTLTNGQLLDLSVLCEKSISKPGRSQELSMLISSNYTDVMNITRDLKLSLYDRFNDAEYRQYEAAQGELLNAYCDKDDQGNPVRDSNNQLVFNDKLIEFQEEMNKLEMENQELLTTVREKMLENEKILSSQHEHELTVTDDYTALPADLEPFWYIILVK